MPALDTVPPEAGRAERPAAGMIVIQLDGVAAATLQRAIDEGLMPTLRRWVDSGRHRLVEWECEIPSQTSASQAGILYGRNDDIPGFRWYEKDLRRLFVSNHPGDAAEMERRLSAGPGLLEGEGSSLGNLLSGDAPRAALTMSSIGRGLDVSDGFYRFFLNPANLGRTLYRVTREVAAEEAQAWGQMLRNVRPRVSRGGSFPFLRAAANVVLRDLTAHLLREDIADGVSVAYATFVGYDVVAHHAGPERPESLRVLRDLDRVVGELEDAARGAERAYEFVLLSDHGQSQGATFRQRYGHPLEELVRDLAHARSVQAPAARGESWGYLNALLSEAVHGERRSARAARRVLRRRTREGYVEVGPDRYARRREEAEVVVCASGSLGHIYLADHPGRLPLESINETYPGLVESLATHEGISFVLGRSEAHGAVVFGSGGVHHLDDGRIDGSDPLQPFGPHAAEQLRRLDAFPHVGDLVVNGRFDPQLNDVCAFEELVGSHGGLGGQQTRPFLLFPSEWPLDASPIVGAPHVHRLLAGWLGRLRGSRE